MGSYMKVIDDFGEMWQYMEQWGFLEIYMAFFSTALAMERSFTK